MRKQIIERASKFNFQIGDRIYYKEDIEEQMVIKKIDHQVFRLLTGSDSMGHSISVADYNVFLVKVRDEGEWIELDRS